MSTDTNPTTERIVVGVDGSAQSVHALRWAHRQARLTGARLDAVIAWRLPTTFGYPVPYDDIDWADAARSLLEKTLTEALGEVDEPQVRRRVIEGHPAPALLAEAADADLLVVANRGHNEFAGLLLGSVSQHVVAHARCPVVVVHGPAEH